MPRTVRRARTALRGLRGLRGLCSPADELRRSPFHTRLPQATSVPHHHSPSDLHNARVGLPPAAFPSLSFSFSLLLRQPTHRCGVLKRNAERFTVLPPGTRPFLTLCLLEGPG